MIRRLGTIVWLVALLGASSALPGAAAAEPAGGDWLLGVWEQPEARSRFEFKREGSGITWRLTRERFQSRNPRWGEKAAVEASGKVTKISDAGVEFDGKYEMSENRALIGRGMKYELKRVGEDTLTGTGLGAGNQPFPVLLKRAK